MKSKPKKTNCVETYRRSLTLSNRFEVEQQELSSASDTTCLPTDEKTKLSGIMVLSKFLQDSRVETYCFDWFWHCNSGYGE